MKSSSIQRAVSGEAVNKEQEISVSAMMESQLTAPVTLARPRGAAAPAASPAICIIISIIIMWKHRRTEVK